MCVCVRERERESHESARERQKCTQIAQGKVTERNERTESDNKLVRGGLCVFVCVCVCVCVCE